MCKTFGACLITMITQTEISASVVVNFTLINKQFCGNAGNGLKVRRDGRETGWGRVGMKITSALQGWA